jgi:hypothetical protein
MAPLPGGWRSCGRHSTRRTPTWSYPQGKADPKGGIRQFVVGTGGGGGEGPISDPIANSKVRTDGTDGVLKLTLHPKSYEWAFVPVEGESFTDSGGAQCH